MNLEKAIARGAAETRRVKSSCDSRLWFSLQDCSLILCNYQIFSASSAAPREKLRFLR